MLTYWLNCKKDTENIDSQKCYKQIMVEQCYYQNVLYVTVKNQDWWKNKKQKGVLSSLGLKTPLRKFSLLGDILL